MGQSVRRAAVKARVVHVVGDGTREVAPSPGSADPTGGVIAIASINRAIDGSERKKPVESRHDVNWRIGGQRKNDGTGRRTGLLDPFSRPYPRNEARHAFNADPP